MKLIDAHCHLDFDCFDSDRDAVLKRAHDAGVEDIVIPGVKAEHWQRITRLCESPQLHACYGIHPYYVDQHTPADLQTLEQQLSTQRSVALGECGLDYRDTQPDRDIQLDFFSRQLDIAHAIHKPVVIHAVRATEDVLKQLKKYPGLTGMVHSYSGSMEQARQLLDMGFYISLGGSISYSRAHKLRKLAAEIPLEGVLIETDAPDQAAAAHNNSRNEPAYLYSVVETLAELREESAEQIAAQTRSNTMRLFGLD